MNIRRQQGFTLIEAAVAIAVVAILSGIIVPLVVKNLQDSQIARAKNDIQVIAASIASQLKDTGTRPTATVNSFADGAGTKSWASTTATTVGGVTLTGTNNTFTTLFCTVPTSTADNPQKLFFGAATTNTKNSEFAYKGPYLANDAAAKTDPWGNPYVIFGYSGTNSATNGPIWVVSAGPNGLFSSATTTLAGLEALTTWPTDTNAVDDIVVRVN
jgi:prepilin-type N-terminal cleavage/methylation domain-containing protein